MLLQAALPLFTIVSLEPSGCVTVRGIFSAGLPHAVNPAVNAKPAISKLFFIVVLTKMIDLNNQMYKKPANLTKISMTRKLVNSFIKKRSPHPKSDADFIKAYLKRLLIKLRIDIRIVILLSTWNLISPAIAIGRIPRTLVGIHKVT